MYKLVPKLPSGRGASEAPALAMSGLEGRRNGFDGSTGHFSEFWSETRGPMRRPKLIATMEHMALMFSFGSLRELAQDNGIHFQRGTPWGPSRSET